MEKPEKAYKGPMDLEWFYHDKNPFALANALHQEQNWTLASEMYTQYLKYNEGTEYDRNMARLNLAACLMAQCHATKHWAAFDALLDIPESQRISWETILNNDSLIPTDCYPRKTILVRTDQVGIGDIFHFISAAFDLRDCTGWNVIISVPNFLKQTLASPAEEYDFNLISIISENDTQPTVDYETHLIALLGHLNLAPTAIDPEKIIFTAPERAINLVLEAIEPVLGQGNTIAAVFLGEERQATLIGGKQLPRNSNDHGRNLDSEPFKQLLRNHPTLTLIDCSNKKNRVTIDEDQKNQYLIIPNEAQAFDTTIALARIMSAKKNIIAFGSNNGPTNVFARSLDHTAQDRMAFIIPNAKENDMRMEGKGAVYKQMISHCWVYKCQTPNDQTKVIEQAYHDISKY